MKKFVFSFVLFVALLQAAEEPRECELAGLSIFLLKVNAVLEERTDSLLTQRHVKLEKELAERFPGEKDKRIQLENQKEEAFTKAKNRRLLIACDDPNTLQKIGSRSLEDEIYSSCQYKVDIQLKEPSSELAQYLVEDSRGGAAERRKCAIAVYEKIKIERSSFLNLKDSKSLCLKAVQFTNEMYQECGL